MIDCHSRDWLVFVVPSMDRCVSDNTRIVFFVRCCHYLQTLSSSAVSESVPACMPQAPMEWQPLMSALQHFLGMLMLVEVNVAAMRIAVRFILSGGLPTWRQQGSLSKNFGSRPTERPVKSRPNTRNKHATTTASSDRKTSFYRPHPFCVFFQFALFKKTCVLYQAPGI